jgi:hypothetical protein
MKYLFCYGLMWFVLTRTHLEALFISTAVWQPGLSERDESRGGWIKAFVSWANFHSHKIGFITTRVSFCKAVFLTPPCPFSFILAFHFLCHKMKQHAAFSRSQPDIRAILLDFSVSRTKINPFVCKLPNIKNFSVESQSKLIWEILTTYYYVLEKSCIFPTT